MSLNKNFVLFNDSYNRKKKYEYFVIRIDSRQMLIIVYVTECSVTYTEI